MTASDLQVRDEPAPGADDAPPPLTGGAGRTTVVPGILRSAAIASIGAGAIHATAAGAHSEHRSAVVAFVLTAIAQIGWGAWALGRSGRMVAVTGVAVSSAALGGWLLAKTTGIGFVTGLGTQESAQFADTAAAVLATVALAGALATLAGHVRTGAAARPPVGSAVHPALVGLVAVGVVALVIPGMVRTGSHTHAGGAAGGHDHAAGAEHGDHGDHAAAAGTPRPYDATLPVDLGGTPGVSAEEQAEAEDLVTRSLQKLPRFADIPTIEAMGYRSIGDGVTGTEHFIKWDLIADGRVLDPDHPESLVFDVDAATGERTLAAAMFMANLGDTLDTVPTVGGPLVQWHVHDDLCFMGDAGAWRVGDVAPPGNPCRPGTFRLGGDGVPMMHVWIRPHECGPFAALEGVGGGQVAAGEARLCDTAHGHHA